MASEAAINALMWMSAAIACSGLALAALSYYWHQNTRDVVRREHHVTRSEIDRVLECVEPEPDGKRIVGLMPPMGPLP